MKLYLLDCSEKAFVEAIKSAFQGDEVTAIDSTKAHGLPEAFFASDYVVTGRKFPLTREIIARLTNCKTIIRNGVGYDNIDTVAARAHDIDVFNISDYCISDVAEHTLGLLLSYTRRLSEYLEKGGMSNLKWGRASFDAIRLNGKRLGIIGLGNIGRAVAVRAAVLGLAISYFDPHRSDTSYQRYDSLQELFLRNDIVSVHVPLSAETRGLIEATAFGSCKNVILINTSRGGIVNYADVLAGLKAGRLQAFLTDVLDVEPPKDNPVYLEYMQKDSPLSGRILITPHVAFSSKESDADLIERVIALIKDKGGFAPIN